MGSDFPVKGGLILTQCPELRAELSAGAFWLTWPKVRGCDTKAARNSPLGISFSSSFISQPKVKILAENFVLYLCSLSLLPSFFFPPLTTATKSSSHQEKNGEVLVREK